jgi:hypothetical protein
MDEIPRQAEQAETPALHRHAQERAEQQRR